MLVVPRRHLAHGAGRLGEAIPGSASARTTTSFITHERVQGVARGAGKDYDAARYVHFPHAHNLLREYARRARRSSASRRFFAVLLAGARVRCCAIGRGAATTTSTWILWGGAAGAWLVTVGVGTVNTTLHHEHGLLAALLLGLWLSTHAARPRILILRRDNIGDLVCTTPLIDALRARYPRAWLGALVNTYNADVLAGNPALDEVFVYEKLKHRRGGAAVAISSRDWRSSRRACAARALDYVLVPSACAAGAEAGAQPEAAGRVLSPSPLWPDDPRHEVERAFTLGERARRARQARARCGFSRMPRRKATIRKQAARRRAVRRRPHQRAAGRRSRWPLAALRGAGPASLAAAARVMLLWAPGGAGQSAPSRRRRGRGEDAARREGRTSCRSRRRT